MFFGFFLAVTTLHSALQSVLLLISVAAPPDRWLPIYLWASVLGLVLCGAVQASVYIPYWLIPLFYVNVLSCVIVARAVIVAWETRVCVRACGPSAFLHRLLGKRTAHAQTISRRRRRRRRR